MPKISELSDTPINKSPPFVFKKPAIVLKHPNSNSFLRYKF